jgi:hypothetical protein
MIAFLTYTIAAVLELVKEFDNLRLFFYALSIVIVVLALSYGRKARKTGKDALTLTGEVLSVLVAALLAVKLVYYVLSIIGF